MVVVAAAVQGTRASHNFFDASSRALPDPPFPIIAQEYLALSDTYSEELRLVSPSDAGSPWRWVAGVFLFEQHIRQALQVPIGDEMLSVEPLVPILEGIGPGLGELFVTTGQAKLFAADLDVRVREYALFADVTRTLLEDWELSLGARLYRTTSGGSNTQSGLATTAQYQAVEHVIADRVSEESINPKASLAW